MKALQRNIANTGALVGALAGRPIFSLFLLALALAPLAFHPLGIGRDYPNHLARVFIQGAIQDQPSLQQSYLLTSQAIPDLAMDLLVAPLVGSVNIYAAGIVFVVFAAALLPIGGLLLHFVLYRRWSLWPLACLPALYSAPLAGGLMNFLAGVGLSLIGFAAWIALRDLNRWLRFAVFLPFAVVLWFWHALGFLALGYLVLVFELVRCAGPAKDQSLFNLRELLLQAVVFVLPLVALVTAFLSLGGLSDEGISFGSPLAMLINFSFAFALSNLIQGVIVLGGIVFLLIALWKLRVIEWHPDVRAPVIAMGLLVLLIPDKFMGISLLQVRFPVLFFFLLFAGSRMTSCSIRLKGLAFLLFGGLFAWQWTHAWQRTAQIDQVQRAMTSAFSQMDTGSRILTAWAPEEERPELVWNELYHSSSLAVIEAMAFEPKLFTNTSRVKLQPALLKLHEPQAYPLTEEELHRGSAMPPPSGERQGAVSETRYFNGWPRTFDYLLWLGRQPLAAPAEWNLTPIATNPDFVLYQIN